MGWCMLNNTERQLTVSWLLYIMFTMTAGHPWQRILTLDLVMNQQEIWLEFQATLAANLLMIYHRKAIGEFMAATCSIVHWLTSTTSYSSRTCRHLWIASALAPSTTPRPDWPSLTPSWPISHWKNRNSVLFFTALFACLNTTNDTEMSTTVHSILCTYCVLRTFWISVANY